MTQVIKPCLSTQEVMTLASSKPKNVWIQGIVCEASRMIGSDMKKILPGITIVQVKQAYPNYYIPTKSLWFSTPLMKNADDYLWENFVREITEADRLVTEYEFEGITYRDTPFTDRLFIKELLLLELPKDDKRYREEGPYRPQKQDDEFYDGMPCTFASFRGTQQLLSAETIRNGVMPGRTHKPMELIELERVPTKHVRTIGGYAKGYGKWRAFDRSKAKKDVVTYDQLKSMTQEHRNAILTRFLPTCCAKGLVKDMKIEGDEENLVRLRCSDIFLDKITKESIS